MIQEYSLNWYESHQDYPLINKDHIPIHQWKEKPRNVSLVSLWDTYVRNPLSVNLKSSLYAGNVRAIYPDRQKEDHQKVNDEYLMRLRELGGVDIFLPDSNGDKIHCMFLSALEFNQKLLSALGKTEDQKIELHSLELENFHYVGLLSEKELKWEENDFHSYYSLNLPLKALEVQEPITDKDNPTVIICGGSAVWFSVYLPVISFFLMHGIHVMAFNYRGYEWSEGITTDKAMYQDLVMCYEYLRQEKDLSLDHLILYANSLGLGPASHFIEKFPHAKKVDLVIDRSFADLSEVIENLLKKHGIHETMTKMVKCILPWIADFRPGISLKNSKGNIALVIDAQDKMIPSSERKALKLILSKRKEGIFQSIDTEFFGHEGNWLKNDHYCKQLSSFLQKIGKVRKINV